MYVLIADLVGSRRVPQPERRRLQGRIERALRRLSTCHEWVARPVTTRGIDEISSVLLHPNPAFDAIVGLNLDLWPHRFRFALATGTIDIAAASGDASAMDGQAFHRAAEALARSRSEKLVVALARQGLPNEGAGLCEQLARLHGSIMTDWSPRTCEVVRAFRAAGTQKETAQRLEISQQAVSEALQRARHRELLATEGAMRTWLGTLRT